MDSSLNDILVKFEGYKETHPNIVNLWKRYINLRKQGMFQLIKQCLDVLEKIDTMNDFTVEELSILIVIQSTIQTNIT